MTRRRRPRRRQRRLPGWPAATETLAPPPRRQGAAGGRRPPAHANDRRLWSNVVAWPSPVAPAATQRRAPQLQPLGLRQVAGPGAQARGCRCSCRFAMLALQGGFARCFQFRCIERATDIAGKVVAKASLTRERARLKVSRLGLVERCLRGLLPPHARKRDRSAARATRCSKSFYALGAGSGVGWVSVGLARPGWREAIGCQLFSARAAAPPSALLPAAADRDPRSSRDDARACRAL